jgi:hypothetical protein
MKMVYYETYIPNVDYTDATISLLLEFIPEAEIRNVTGGEKAIYGPKKHRETGIKFLHGIERLIVDCFDPDALDALS